MKPIARRTFLRSAGQATALASIGRASAASGRILLISDPADPLIASPTVRWAAGELRSAIESKGLECAMVRSASETGDFHFAVTIARERSPLAAEAFRLAPSALQGKPGLHVSASDVRGYVYAITARTQFPRSILILRSTRGLRTKSAASPAHSSTTSKTSPGFTIGPSGGNI
jgi:hypothetical protein